MNIILKLLDDLGRTGTAIAIILLVVGIVVWVKGIAPALLRLGNGLAKRKIALFAKGDNLGSLCALLTDSKLFSKKNVIEITSKDDVGRASEATLFLVYWPDWSDEIDTILHQKNDGTALVVYAPQDKGRVPDEVVKNINGHRNAILTNFRGRLLNDLVSSMITTSYER